MAPFLLQLLRAGSRPLPRKTGSAPRRVPVPVGSPNPASSFADSRPDAVSRRPPTSPVQGLEVVVDKRSESVIPAHHPAPINGPSAPLPRVEHPIALPSPEARSRPDNRLPQGGGTNSAASPENLTRSASSASELPEGPASPPAQARANQFDGGIEKSSEHPPLLPVAQVESTHWQMPREMETRITGRRDFSPPAPLSSRKVPYVEFVAKGRVVSTLGPPPPADSPRLREENKRPSPYDTAPGGSKQKPQPQLAMEAAPVFATRVHGQETESGEKPATRIPAPAIIRPALMPDTPTRATLGRLAENQGGASWHARRDDTRTGQPASTVDNSVNIKRIDIQILNEEPRNPSRQPRLASFEESISARLDRHYIREIV
jgi:hypothetical protein